MALLPVDAMCPSPLPVSTTVLKACTEGVDETGLCVHLTSELETCADSKDGGHEKELRLLLGLSASECFTCRGVMREEIVRLAAIVNERATNDYYSKDSTGMVQ
eukprot:3090780-Amphidinium_carterae.1